MPPSENSIAVNSNNNNNIVKHEWTSTSVPHVCPNGVTGKTLPLLPDGKSG